MTTKNRIVAIRLSHKLERNLEYAKKLGINVTNGKADNWKKQVQNNKIKDK